MTYLRGFNRKVVNWDHVSAVETHQERYGLESGWQVRAHVDTMERFVVLGTFETEREARKALTAILNDGLIRAGVKRAKPAATPPYEVVARMENDSNDEIRRLLTCPSSPAA